MRVISPRPFTVGLAVALIAVRQPGGEQNMDWRALSEVGWILVALLVLGLLVGLSVTGSP